MTYRVEILDEAQRELKSIIEYLLNVLKSPQAADNLLCEFDRQVDLIAPNPSVFAVSNLPELASKGYRTAHINNYIMLYTLRNDVIYIAHIFHQRQDYARLV